MPKVYTHDFQTEAFKGKVEVNIGLFIGGEWVDSSEGKTIEYVLLVPIASHARADLISIVA